MPETSSNPNNPDFLYEVLRSNRNRLAREMGLAPYRILPNKVLKDIAQAQPTTLEDLSKIKGIRSKKISQFGSFLLHLVNSNRHAKPKTDAEDIVLTVSEFLDFINQTLTGRQYIVRGEIGRIDIRDRTLYLTLLDKKDHSLLNCLLWRDSLNNIGVDLNAGMEVEIMGRPQVYKARGNLTFLVERFGLVGEGVLKVAFEKLKRQLASAGYFSPARKKAIPAYVRNIGLITSTYGDAKTDFLKHLGPYGFKVCFFDVRVEGLHAVDDLTRAIKWFNENAPDVDVLVLTRGGGGWESLQPYNHEAVAKAIFSSKIPILTGIGHENDETIADLVTDGRASTPTDAARVLSDPWRRASILLTNHQRLLTSALNQSCVNLSSTIKRLEQGLDFNLRNALGKKSQRIAHFHPLFEALIRQLLTRAALLQREFFNHSESLERYLDRFSADLSNAEKFLSLKLEYGLEILTQRLDKAEKHLQMGDPLTRLRLGYSLVFDQQDRIVKSSEGLQVGDPLNLKFYKGGAGAKIEEVS